MCRATVGLHKESFKSFLCPEALDGLPSPTLDVTVTAQLKPMDMGDVNAAPPQPSLREVNGT